VGGTSGPSEAMKKTKRRPKRSIRKSALRVHDIIVTHLIGAPPGIGWIFSIEAAVKDAIDSCEPWPEEIATLLDKKNSTRPLPAKEKELLIAAQQAAKDACRQILELRLDDSHPVAKVISQAMAAIHLGWQAEVWAARYENYFPLTITQKKGGKKSVKVRREAADAQLYQLAVAYLACERELSCGDELWRPVKMADVAEKSGIKLQKLKSAKRRMRDIKKRAQQLKQEHTPA
jgi:hypothetical protein